MLPFRTTLAQGHSTKTVGDFLEDFFFFSKWAPNGIWLSPIFWQRFIRQSNQILALLFCVNRLVDVPFVWDWTLCSVILFPSVINCRVRGVIWCGWSCWQLHLFFFYTGVVFLKTSVPGPYFLQLSWLTGTVHGSGAHSPLGESVGH